jgi:outer membrane protein OmpA-like peptidoglycan-associated protein
MSRMVAVALLVVAGLTHAEPSADRDGDGLPDWCDLCPDEPEDKDGFADADGCPDPDNDEDGVPDVKDRCPNDHGKAPDGCPTGSGRRVYGVHDLFGLSDIYFERDSAVPTKSSAKLLADIAATMKSFRNEVPRWELRGHADRSEADADKLGDARARFVRDRLVALGVDARRLIVRSIGAREPAKDPAHGKPRIAKWNYRVRFNGNVECTAASRPPE